MTTVPHLSVVAKASSLGLGVGAGLASGIAAHNLLPSPETERALERRGISTISGREATTTFAPMAFVGAAAIGTGIGRRSSTAALTTASLGAAAMLASTGASAMVNADSDSADEYLRTLGLMSGVAAAGFAVGAMDEIPLARAKLAGLGLVGLAVGALLPETGSYVIALPGELSRSVRHRNG